MTKYIAKKPDASGNIYFTREENETWQILYERQIQIIRDRACDEYIRGLVALDMPSNRIPQCGEISETLMAKTQFSVVPVEAMISLDAFFTLLANRKFPAACFIRVREELDYLQEPDIFHEFFGHCPLITNPAVADFIQWYGENALRTNSEAQSLLGRLFWFTIEFGLLQTPEGIRIYGGGILSSYAETIYAIESPAPERIPFEVNRVLETPYRYDEIQKCYFVLNELDDLFKLKSDRIIELVKSKISGTQGDDFIIC